MSQLSVDRPCLNQCCHGWYFFVGIWELIGAPMLDCHSLIIFIDTRRCLMTSKCVTLKNAWGFVQHKKGQWRWSEYGCSVVIEYPQGCGGHKQGVFALVMLLHVCLNMVNSVRSWLCHLWCYIWYIPHCRAEGKSEEPSLCPSVYGCCEHDS